MLFEFQMPERVRPQCRELERKELKKEMMFDSKLTDVSNKENIFDGKMMNAEKHSGVTGQATSLYSRLAEEAEKIRKWKFHTEMEMQKQEKELHHADQTIDTLRNTLLDLQLQNECLSNKIQEEINTREETEFKVNSTRDLCDALKCHMKHLEESLAKCEEDKDQLKVADNERLKQFEELSQQFEKLTVTHQEKIQEAERKLMTERDANMEQKQHYESQVCEVELKLKQTSEEVDKKSVLIDSLTDNLGTSEELAKSLQKEIDELTNKLKSSDDSLEKSETVETELNLKLSELQDVINQLENELETNKNTIADLTKEEKELQSQLKQSNEIISELRKSLGEMEVKVADEKKIVIDLQSTLKEANRTIQDLKSSKDKLLLEKGEMTGKLEDTQQELVCLKEKHTALVEDHNKLIIEKTDWQTAATESDEKLKLVQVDLVEANASLTAANEDKQRLDAEYKHASSELEKRENEAAHLRSALVEAVQREDTIKCEIESLNLQLKSGGDEFADMTKKLRELKKEKQALEEHVTKYRNDLAKTNNDLENCNDSLKKLREELDTCEDECRELRSLNEEFSLQLEQKNTESVTAMKETKQTNNKLESIIEAKEREISKLTSKQSSLKEDLQTKNKKLKELEKELKCLKSELTTKKKSSSSLVEELTSIRNRLEESEISNEDLQAKVESVSKELEEESKKADDLTKENKKLKADLKKQELEWKSVVNEYDETNKRLHTSSENMISELEKKLADRRQNEHAVDMKIEGMKVQVEKAEREVNKCKKEKQYVEDELTKAKTEVEKTKGCLNAKDAKLQELENKLSKLELPFERPKRNQQKENFSPANLESFTDVTPTLKTYSTPKRTPTLATRGDNVLDGRKEVFETPSHLIIPQEPTSGMPTPIHGILRRASNTPAAKRRKVAFSDFLASSPESSADAIEVDVDVLTNKLQHSVTPTPTRKSTPLGNKMQNVNPLLSNPKPVPRRSASKKEKESTDADELFSTKHNDYSRSSASTPKQAAPNAKKMAPKSGRKFFKSTLQDRHLVRQMQKTTKVDMAWFEDDTAFRFSSED